MKAVLIACSIQGFHLMKRAEALWKEQEPELETEELVKCAGLPEISETRSLKECVGERFDRTDALIFFCAAGIAVRSIAPWLGHKSEDPAVLVVDETGKYCISLLSGHAGGANALTLLLAGLLHAEPVITTATDREGLFAVDLFAGKNGLALTDWELAKKISAAVLAGEPVGFGSRLPVEGALPKELRPCVWDGAAWKQKEEENRSAGSHQEPCRLGILVTWEKPELCRRRAPFLETLVLTPRAVTLGIGCRKGVTEAEVEEAAERCLEECGVFFPAIRSVASIDRKKDEAGLLSFCQKKGIPFRTYSAQELAEVKGSGASSAFVQRTVGVDNVCERSALADTGGVLLCPKRIYGRVTVAAAAGKERILF